jgi:hypothetical protein
MEIKAIHDFDEIDNVQKYMILQNAKELLAYLNGEPGFPYDAYFDGSTALQKAMAYVDDKLLHPTVGE